MTRTLAYGFAVGFLVVLVLVTLISLRPHSWNRSLSNSSSASSPNFYMPRPRALNLHAHFGTLRRVTSSRSSFSALSGESEEAYEKTAVKREISGSYAPTPQIKSSGALSMLAAAPGHILALITSPVPLRSRPAPTPAPPTIHLSFAADGDVPSPAKALPIIHRRRGAISLVRPPPPNAMRERPDSLQSFESPSVYSQVTPIAHDEVPTIMVSAPSCPTLEYPEEGREGRLLGPRGFYF
ncbi:hypothetical protein PENSPDRAFT_655725 [Peniophora sp. CONT]|nr:hypothetical protein PENSPDRAFT_655725 [Peniophora sp. CONT]